MDNRNLRLPVINQVVLRGFSLFDEKPEIKIELNDGVCCIAGANGLGKSTLLAATSYALTGIVAPPGRRFLSPEEYYKDARNFSARYFEGRIREADRDLAEVEISTTIGKWRYTVIRGVFESEQLRHLEILDENGESIPGLDPGESSEELERLYRKMLPAHVGLADFWQYSFLHHFVFSFDERRHLLLWDETTLQECLALAFGQSPEEARLATDLRRTAEKADSLARNYQYQATILLKRIKELNKLTDEDESSEETRSLDEIRLALKSADEEIDGLVTLRDKRDKNLADAKVDLAELLSKENVIEEECDILARIVAESDENNARNSLTQVQATGECLFCGQSISAVLSVLEAKLANNLCPLCDRHVHLSEALDVVTAIDRLAEAQQRLHETMTARLGTEDTVSRLASEIDDFEEQLGCARDKKSEMESSLREVLRTEATTESESALEAGIKDLELSRKLLLKKKKKKREQRDKAHLELDEIQKEIERRYISSSEEFVHVFKSLARSFLGLDLGIHIELSKPSRIGLFLEMEGSSRRETFQVSESQRFFLDVALRMALMQYMKQENLRSTFLIDTPEGALDIAYEAHAGDMFAEYIGLGNNLFMTANINTSQLLLNLATRCRAESMVLYRMTEWAHLSDVQQAEEGRFTEVLDRIEGVLAG